MSTFCSHADLAYTVEPWLSQISFIDRSEYLNIYMDFVHVGNLSAGSYVRGVLFPTLLSRRTERPK